jgi:NAD(P)-dependent dehydrogenase (short-subunit alcohol dehydrogenase family)
VRRKRPSRALASELGPRNIRVICLRLHAIAGAVAAGSYTVDIFQPKARAAGLSVAAWLEGAAGTTMLGRLPTLTQIAETAAFLVSDHAGAMTGTVVDVTAGLVAE